MTSPYRIQDIGIQLDKPDETQSILLTPTNGYEIRYDLQTANPKTFKINNSGVSFQDNTTNYTTGLERISAVQQAFQAVELPPNATTLKINNDIQFSDGVTTSDIGISGTNLQVSGAPFVSSITQPVATDSSTKIPTTAWVQSAIDAKTNITDTNTSSVFYPLFSSDTGNQSFRADKTTTPWTINPSTGDFTFNNTINIVTTANPNINTAIGTGGATAGTDSIAIGRNAGQTSQGATSVAIGRSSGTTSQGANAVAVGVNAGNSSQGSSAVAIGINSGVTSQGGNSVAIGSSAGNSSQSTSCVAIGANAGTTTQGGNSVAIGSLSGNNLQGSNATAIGIQSGQRSQGIGSTSIGLSAGRYGQGTNAVAIGSSAGSGNADANLTPITGTTQGNNAIAIGSSAARYGQGLNSVAIGVNAGTGTVDGNGNTVLFQGSNCVAIGNNAGTNGQGNGCVAIGAQSGGATSQTANSIIINASGQPTTASLSACYIRPVRGDATKQLQMQYNSTTFEVSATAQVVSPVTTSGLDVTGDAGGLLATTAGGSSGQHLRIVINNVTYKIALLNN